MVASGRSTPLGTPNRRESISLLPQPNSTSVKVVLRIRPTSDQDYSSNVPQRFQRVVVHPSSSSSLQIEHAPIVSAGASASVSTRTSVSDKQSFTFDRVVGPGEGQQAVYECAESLVDAFMEGMNATILAYGQTSSGKSYTMGTDSPPDEAGPDRLGITPRAVSSIFERVKLAQAASGGRSTFGMKLSYIEIYNEDLIDLLVEVSDHRPLVQIREDKQGNIMWSGLREVTVSSAAEVMRQLTLGSTLRQTGATDMNAQSSRSHAIFSLTLTQRKYTGTGSPPSPQNGSRIASHRMSGLPSRVTSPTPGSRSQTPTNDRPGSRFGLRPPSALGRPSTPSAEDKENGADSWVSITSKFHFVDLAGSERLKRTSAQGERVKEGISINAGLHALGNVISALGDPARARQTTHIPYRDSKLTRLLQDSLGGNSQTMMVACVSPTEFNVNETLSTLKYANRARNIKNRAEVNAVEVGWDDVDYLQKTILKLRSEVTSLKNGDAPMGAIAEEGSTTTRGVSVNPELEQKYLDLTRQCAQLTAELQKAQAGSINGVAGSMLSTLSREDFAKVIEPVVEEYEKSLSALESQLALTKAALSHQEDEMRELEERANEESRTNEASSILISELKSRVAKLAEREATTEAYVRDLEAKLKDFGEQDESHGSAVSELRKEITKNREQSDMTEQYIKELEGRLAKSDDVQAGFKRQIDLLERDIERREEAYRDLENRLSLLDTTHEHKLLLAEIDEKDKKLLELERTLDELKGRHLDAEQETTRLHRSAAAEKAEKEELQSRVRTLERASLSLKSRPTSYTPPQTPAESSSTPVNPLAADSALIKGLEGRIADLETTHERTLAELDIATTKYQDSLKAIEDLQSQVEEQRLISVEDGDRLPSPASPSFTQSTHDDTDFDQPNEKRLSLTTSSLVSPTRTPRSRRSMPLASQNRLSFLGRGQGAQVSHLRSASLSQELSLAQGLQHLSSPPSPRPLSPIYQRDSRDLSFGSPTNDRTYEQMKNEVMKLQQALSEREEEITALETSIHKLRGSSTPALINHANESSPPRIVTNGMSTPPRPSTPVTDVTLSPKTQAAFDALKSDIARTQPESAEVPVDPASSARLDDLMRSMAQKESAHREAVDALEDQLSALRRQHDELTVLSRNQVENMSSEIGRLRIELEGRPEASHYEDRLRGLEEDLAVKNRSVDESRREAEVGITTLRATLENEHQAAIESLIEQHSASILQLKEEHASSSTRHVTEREDALSKQQRGHTRALEDLSDKHASALESIRTESLAAIKRKTDEHEEAVKRFEIERSGLADAEKEGLSTTIARLNEQHDDILHRRETDHKSRLSSLGTEHNAALEKLKTDHEHALDQILLDQSQAQSRLRDEHESTLSGLRREHADATATLQTEVERLSAELTKQSEEAVRKIAEHTSALDRLRGEHAELVEKSSSTPELAQAEARIAELEASSTSASTAHVSSLEKLAQEHETAFQALAQSHAAELASQASKHEQSVAELHATNAEVLDTQKHAHDAALAEAIANRETDVESRLKTLDEQHQGAIAGLLEQHGLTIASLTETHESDQRRLRDEHREAAEAQISGHTAAIDAIKLAHAKELEDMAASYASNTSAHEKLASDFVAMSSRHEEATKILASSNSAQEDLLSQLDTLQQSHLAVTASHQQEVTGLHQTIKDLKASGGNVEVETELAEALDALSTLEKALLESQEERERLVGELQDLRTKDAAPPVAEVSPKELEDLRQAVAKQASELTMTRGERDALALQVGRISATINSPVLDSEPFMRPFSPVDRAKSPTNDLRSSLLGVNGLPLTNGKAPPPTPPPSMPPPPLPTGAQSRTARSSSSSSISTLYKNGDASGSPAAMRMSTSADSVASKKVEEQEAHIGRLNKQLAHCESDLQANIDLVNTLESALNDSERNLRKARQQMGDLTRERDGLSNQNDALRRQIQDAHSEVETVRSSVIQVETRLQDERRQKDDARRQLESRLQEVNSRKSKFNCF